MLDYSLFWAEGEVLGKSKISTKASPWILKISQNFSLSESSRLSSVVYRWAATWQNQQSDCVPSEDSDLPSLIRVFAVCMKKAWINSYPLSGQPRLIRLGGCSGWSESSLGAHSLCWFCRVAAQMYIQLWSRQTTLQIPQWWIMMMNITSHKRHQRRISFATDGKS